MFNRDLKYLWYECCLWNTDYVFKLTIMNYMTIVLNVKLNKHFRRKYLWFICLSLAMPLLWYDSNTVLLQICILLYSITFVCIFITVVLFYVCVWLFAQVMFVDRKINYVDNFYESKLSHHFFSHIVNVLYIIYTYSGTNYCVNHYVIIVYCNNL